MFPSRVHRPPPGMQRVQSRTWKAPERLEATHWKKSAICISCHQAWSSFRPADCDIRSPHNAHKGQRFKTPRRRPADPECVHLRYAGGGDKKTTPPPISTLCALSEPPATSVSFITGSDGSAANSGVPPLQEPRLSPPKGQWCCPEASSLGHDLLLGRLPIHSHMRNNNKASLCPNCRYGCGWVRNCRTVRTDKCHRVQCAEVMQRQMKMQDARSPLWCDGSTAAKGEWLTNKVKGKYIATKVLKRV